MGHTHGSISGGVNNKTTYDFSDGLFTLTQELTCDVADKDDFTPALGSTVSEGGKTYGLSRATQETLPGGLAKIVLTYTASAFDSGSLPADSYSESTSQLEVDIREHPSFDDWSGDWDDEKGEFKAGTEKYGIRSYIKGTTQVVKTEYFSSKPSSPYANVGKLDSPGSDYGSGDHWLVIGATRQKLGDIWTRETTYLYSAKEWDDQIYSS